MMREARGNKSVSMRGRMFVGIAGALIWIGSLLVPAAQAQLLEVPRTYAGDL